MRKDVHFILNGKELRLSGNQAFSPLSDILRYELGKTGTKVVCAEGDCGACTVMVARSRSKNEKLRFRSINSCILTGFLVDGCHVITVEGLSSGDQLHEIQDAMVRNYSSQCGFCTPGFVMSLGNMFEHNEKPDVQNVKNYLTGNLCRCTGYQSIIDAAMDVDTAKLKKMIDLFPPNTLQESLLEKTSESLLIETEVKKVFAPTSLDEAIEYLTNNKDVRIFSGATDLGVQINKGHKISPTKMSLHLIDELYSISRDGDEVTVGAKVTLDQLQTELENDFIEFADFLNIFASPQIKNSATLVGNLANASPIADTIPVLYALEAKVEVYGSSGLREVEVSQFIKGYKQLDLKEDEIIKSIRFNIPKRGTKVGFYKISQRRDLDISAINAGFLMNVENNKIISARIAYGGVGPTTLRLREVEKHLVGHEINNELWKKAWDEIPNNVSPISDLRGSAEFRTLMAQKLFEKFTQEKFANE